MVWFSKNFKEYYARLKKKIEEYKHIEKAKSWLESNKHRVQLLFENFTIRDFIFEPFKDVFKSSPNNNIDTNTYSVITQVAIVNAVLAGLPGKLGVGVYIAMALEGWMAYRIAKNVGINIKNTSDIWKYFGLLTLSAATILYVFKILLGFTFSLVSIIPGVNPLIIAELLVTDLIGVLFLVGFKEASRSGSFRIPKRMWLEVSSSTKSIFIYQYNYLKNVLSIDNIKMVGHRLSSYLKGDFPVDMRLINGEAFATVAMAYLLSGQSDKLDGPLGDAFLEAIRLRWSAQLGPDATQEEIAHLFSKYDHEQMDGVINTVKGKMFEIMVTHNENMDDDKWFAKMHTNESFPGSDIVFTNNETREQIEVSLKAVAENRPEIIESALVKYPDISIMTTDEMAELFKNDTRVFGSEITHEELQNITEDNMDKLLEIIEPRSPHEVVIGGVSVGMVAALWPFVIAHMRGKISRESLTNVCSHTMGAAGVSLASRLGWATLLGPIFAWYLLARGVKGIVVIGGQANDRRLLVEFEHRNT